MAVDADRVDGRRWSGDGGKGGRGGQRHRKGREDGSREEKMEEEEGKLVED